MIAKVQLWGRTIGAVSLDEVVAAVKRWPEFAAEAKLSDAWRDRIQKTHRLELPGK